MTDGSQVVDALFYWLSVVAGLTLIASLMVVIVVTVGGLARAKSPTVRWAPGATRRRGSSDFASP